MGVPETRGVSSNLTGQTKLVSQKTFELYPKSSINTCGGYMKLNVDDVVNAVKECHSYNDLSVKMFGFSNGKTLKKLRNFVFNNRLDTTHFDVRKNKRKYEIIEKICPVCGKTFTDKKGYERERTTCSHSCSNTYFRSGENNGNWSEDAYRTTCFSKHEKKCVVCGESKIVEVHHYDGDHSNNKLENLIPLCPTHHQYCHSKYVIEIKDIINSYRNNFIGA